MVKPALAYLDVVAAVRAATAVPVAAYQVSGEYAMLEAAAARGWIDRGRAITESLTAIRRGGGGARRGAGGGGGAGGRGGAGRRAPGGGAGAPAGPGRPAAAPRRHAPPPRPRPP